MFWVQERNFESIYKEDSDKRKRMALTSGHYTLTYGFAPPCPPPREHDYMHEIWKLKKKSQIALRMFTIVFVPHS